jgi:O-antigen/teichoic acid export membrane protein
MNANKRIAFNTVILYIKLVISIIIGLYTSRLVLLALGASDYGLYSVIGGIVVLLNTIGITMVSTSYRYISIEIGKGKSGNINKVYNTVFVVHLILAAAFLLVGMTVGTWYVNNILNVADIRRPDALYVLYASLMTTVFSIISIPSNGLIIAREKFLFTSIVEIIQLLLKLLVIVILVVPYSGNRLRLYALLMAFVQIVQPLTYTVYCLIKERDVTKWKFNKCWRDYKEIIQFTGWLFLGAICVLGNNQGAAIIMNLFFGTVVNAAFGIAMQVQNYISMFVKNLGQATYPQIMKNYGSNNESRSLELVYKISKYSFLIMLMITIPVIISIKEVLLLWLKKVPEYTDVFVALLLINGLIACLNSGFDALIQASGKIRKNQVGYSIINISLLPIIYILYKAGSPCYINVYVMLFLTSLTIIFQGYILKGLSNFSTKEYFRMTVYPCLKVLLVSSIILCLIFINPSNGIMPLIYNTIISFAWVFAMAYVVGLDKNEKLRMKTLIINKIRK